MDRYGEPLMKDGRCPVVARRTLLFGLAALAARAYAQTAAPSTGTAAEPAPAPPSRRPDVIFVPTPYEVVDEMLRVANVGPKDVLYDLGSGDGRIPIAAAKRFGTRGLGVDIDPQRIAEANENARAAGVTDKVRFVQGDLFEMDLAPATVITLYLLPELNLKLRPKLLALKRIVSHAFDMGDWKPDESVQVGTRSVYFWRIPERRRVGGAAR
jgi:hypothetical protein